MHVKPSSMASPKHAIVAYSILLALLLVQANQVSSNGVAEISSDSPTIDCKGACAERCKLSGRPNLCKRACGTCCGRCNCVPPGTSGNYEACPCYAKLTTRDNKLKCP